MVIAAWILVLEMICHAEVIAVWLAYWENLLAVGFSVLEKI